MTKKVKKGWTYVEGHYRDDGTWVPAHWSLWRQLALPISVLVALCIATLYLLFGRVVLLAVAVLSITLWICIIGKKYAFSTSMMRKLSLGKEKGNRLKLYEELCSKLKESEIFENLIDMQKLSKHENPSQKDPSVERRKLERTDLRLPAKICDLEREKGVQHTFLTKNICAGGAFFKTKEHYLPENARVSIDLVLLTVAQIKFTGFVLRSEPTGIAVRFDDEYQVTPLVKTRH